MHKTAYFDKCLHHVRVFTQGRLDIFVIPEMSIVNLCTWCPCSSLMLLPCPLPCQGICCSFPFAYSTTGYMCYPTVPYSFCWLVLHSIWDYCKLSDVSLFLLLNSGLLYEYTTVRHLLTDVFSVMNKGEHSYVRFLVDVGFYFSWVNISE